ncbi:MAG: hypothetical protein M0R48_00515 [Candidatus Omnitrophica bacterium]|jgi:hypothetical protein|nr:hypothetical protein [Candidatus Omnitrophota bacterium]
MLELSAGKIFEKEMCIQEKTYENMRRVKNRAKKTRVYLNFSILKRLFDMANMNFRQLAGPIVFAVFSLFKFKIAVFLTQVVCNRWIKNSRGGRALNISSTAGFLGVSYPYRMDEVECCRID